MKNLFRSIAVISCLSIPAATQAQILEHQWSKAIVGTHSVSAGEMVTDGQGNVYVHGTFTGTADLDPGAGTASVIAGVLPLNGGTWFGKYDTQGNHVFSRQLGDSGQVTIRDIAVDNDGNILLTGTIRDTVDIDPGPGVATLNPIGGIRDIFVAKFDATGNYVLAFCIGGNNTDGVDQVATDAAGNIYISGTFRDTMDLDPGSGVQEVLAPSGDDNVYLAKYSPTGSLIYGFDLNNTDASWGLVVDGPGNVLLTGTYTGTFDADPGPGVNQVQTVAGVDGFLAKYDPSGNYVMSFGLNALMLSIDTDADGNIYATGRVQDSMDFDPGPGVANLGSENELDIYIAKYDANGNYITGRSFMSDGVYQSYDLKVNMQGHVYLYGYAVNTDIDLNPGGSGGMLTGAGDRDIFIAKFLPNLNFSYAYHIASPLYETASGICLDNSGRVWLSGSFNGTLDLNFGSTSNVESPNGAGGFIARYIDQVAAGIEHLSQQALNADIYAAESKIFINFSELKDVNADIKVLNMLGQTVLQTTHSHNDILELKVADAAPQLYTVVVNNKGVSTAKKVWLE